MSKQHKLVLHSQETGEVKVTDWNKCVLCQKHTKENLRNPANFRGSNTKCNADTGYKILGANLNSFSKIGSLPMDIDIARLDDGSGIENTLRKNQAKWHKSCRNKVDNQKLNRAAKKRAASD